VAIKILNPDLAGAIGIDRFVREIRLTAKLQHPGIVPVLDSGTLDAPDGTKLPWYSMGYVDGESLRARLERERQLPIDAAIAITCEAAAALDAAHRQGIVHRDIKPENLLLSGDRVCVADFGIAKALMDTGGDRLTSTGIVIGTPAYMSPEQAASEPVDARTDQYSLATVLYEMLAGEPPFSGRNPQSIISRRIAEPARRIRSVRPAISDDLEATILRALERIPADRFHSVAEFAAALRNPESVPRKARAKSRPASIRVAAVAAAIVAVVAVGGWLIANQRDSSNDARSPQAIELYERGMRAYDRRTPASIVEAVQALNAALRIDSTYTDAWAGLARTYVRAYERRFFFPGISTDSMLRLAVAAGDRALAGNPRSADVWVTQAIVRRNVDPTDPRSAIRAARQALAIDSMNAPAWHFVALSEAELGNFPVAMSAWRRAVSADPAYLQGLAFLSIGHYWLGQHDSAAFWADSAISVDPNYLLGRTTAGYAAIELGNFSRARAHFDAARRLSSGVEMVNSVLGVALADARSGAKAEAARILAAADSMAKGYTPAPLHTVVFLAEVHAALGNNDPAIEWIRRYSPLEDLHFQLHLRCEAALAPLAKDPRYPSLLVNRASDQSRDCGIL
ncbi:MAG TPA: protein kinase, partial [Gemmatimonadaceae bacterium]|nr:protein kinase [Gemmatimonadaceae bacterium]